MFVFYLMLNLNFLAVLNPISVHLYSVELASILQYNIAVYQSSCATGAVNILTELGIRNLNRDRVLRVMQNRIELHI